MNVPFSNSKNGFTIIETLVAITILMIAVAGPMVAANRGLNAAQYSKNQLVASFLAQETMEVLKNVRSNIVTYAEDSIWIVGDLADCFGIDNKKCDVSALDPRPNDPINFQEVYTNCELVNNCIVTLNSDGYSHEGGLSQFRYHRYFYFDQISPSEVRAHVVVAWNQGTIPYEIELMSELVNINR